MLVFAISIQACKFIIEQIDSINQIEGDANMALLERMSKYIRWADSKIWDIVASLNENEYSRDLGENIGSIKRRYIHLAEDYREWYYDWIGQDPGEKPDFITMKRDELFKSIQQYTKKFIEMIENRAIESIKINVTRKEITLTFDEIFFHLVNHATYHRGQIVMALRILGKEVQMTDYVPFKIQTA